MKVWTNTEFEGYYSIGTAAVVVAETAEQAADLLNDDLQLLGLTRSATAEQFHRLPVNTPKVLILNNGNY
jgi:hypothetical protein